MRLYYLKKISEILDDLKINHAIFDGALLGFVRERNFIAWDWDAEISISYNDFKCYRLKLIEKIEKESIGKIYLNNSYTNPKINIILNNNFKYTIQAFHYSKNNEYIYRKMYKYPAKFLNHIEKIKIKEYYFPIPKQAEELLCLEYGKDWRIPLNSQNKSEYLSTSVYTKKNNIINNTYIKIIQKIKYYAKITNKFIKNYLNNYPVLEYNLRQNREQLFILQLYKIAKKHTQIILIEIGSSDLKENIILTKILNKTKITSVIYEASKETYTKLIKKREKNKLNNLYIVNKAIIPDEKTYYLRESNEKNLNRIVSQNIERTTAINDKNILRFDEIQELYTPNIHKIIKMDIEGLEESILTKNSKLLSQLINISLCIELHQQSYKNPKKLKESILYLIENKFRIKFIEFSMYSNKLILKKYKKNNNLIAKNNKRYLIKNPNTEIIDHIVNCDYQIIKQAPFYSPKNIRSVTLHKDR